MTEAECIALSFATPDSVDLVAVLVCLRMHVSRGHAALLQIEDHRLERRATIDVCATGCR